MKFSFQNVRTINDEKTLLLKQQLNNFDLLCMSELNKCYDFDKKTINDNEFQYHTDPSTSRIGFMASNTLEISIVEKGLVLTQERQRISDVAIQTFIYKIKSKNRDIYIENVYVVPDATIENLNTLTLHIESQSRKFRYYIVGGDFNLNWKTAKIRQRFKDLAITQVVKDYTRVQKYKKFTRNDAGEIIMEQDRVSKTLIDLVFVNDNLRPFVKDVAVEQLSDKFDHKVVCVEFDFIPSPRYRYIDVPLDPLKRPTPNDQQIQIINDEIKNLKPKSLESFLGSYRIILDKEIPTYPTNSSKRIKIFRTPLSPGIVTEIKEKKKLHKFRHSSIRNWRKYKLQRNKVVNLVRKAKADYCNNQIKKQNTAQDIQKTIDRLHNHYNSKIHNDNTKLEVNGYSGFELANKMAQYYKDRAENLVTDQEMLEVGEPNDPLLPTETLEPMIPPTFQKYNDLKDFIPEKKITSSHGPGKISSKIVQTFWDNTKLHLNKLLEKGNFKKYPLFSQGFYQRTIPKTNKVKIFKDLRPLGILNSITKYLLNKPVFKYIRSHIKPILEKRHNFSFKGTHMCIINTFEKILEKITKKLPTFLVKYDFSNAFGTLNHKTFLNTAKKLNIHKDIISYLQGYLKNQKSSQTVVRDRNGTYISKTTNMARGTVQGQVGADVCFSIQQLCLRELDGVYRTIYVDDINDILSGKTFDDVIALVKGNEESLALQSKKIGFKLNDDKTELIPFNVKGADLKEVICTSFSKLLGLPFIALNTGFDMSPAIEMICNRLKMRANKIHILRNYVTDKETLVKAAKAFVYHCIGELHLAYVYSRSQVDDFNKVQTQINNVIRATGLSIKTPQPYMDMCLGTELKSFINHSILCNGLKIIGLDFDNNLDRTLNFRHKFPVGGYMYQFVNLWKNLVFEDKFAITQLKTIYQIKNFLKSKRKLKYIPSIHITYKWMPYKRKDTV